MAHKKVDEKVRTIVLTPRDLGLGHFSYASKILDPTLLKKCGERNSNDVELIPLEFVDAVFRQYSKKKRGEGAYVATEMIRKENGEYLYYIRWCPPVISWVLEFEIVTPLLRFSDGIRFIFRLRKKSA
ncbi:MAG: hypothetical protein NTU85_01210 [Candidatus Kaiserbacteria bacterium]|nr:hypothetical protein [Candidatus Kaiserbacteria bacterium]